MVISIGVWYTPIDRSNVSTTPPLSRRGPLLFPSPSQIKMNLFQIYIYIAQTRFPLLKIFIELIEIYDNVHTYFVKKSYSYFLRFCAFSVGFNRTNIRSNIQQTKKKRKGRKRYELIFLHKNLQSTIAVSKPVSRGVQFPPKTLP